MNQLPKWLDQTRVCFFTLNNLKYRLAVEPTFENVILYTDYFYNMNPYRFAAMCMQTFVNGRPVQFYDVPEPEDEIMDTYSEGYERGLNNELPDCRYPEGTELYDDWWEGYGVGLTSIKKGIRCVGNGE